MLSVRTAKEHESRFLLLDGDFQWFLVALPVNRLDAVELQKGAIFKKMPYAISNQVFLSLCNLHQNQADT